MMSAELELPDPIFLFSLPRSGSTFVQSVLGAHEEIATASEPWLLLPYLYTLREKGIYADYGHHLAARALHDFYSSFDEGKEDYLFEIRNMALRLYARSAGYAQQQYFLDKTPRYHLVVEDILEMFPDGKFVFLWRNPLSIIASILQTWGQGKWNLYKYHVDLFDGMSHLVSAYQNHADRVVGVRYEDLVTNSFLEWERIFDYLNLPFDEQLLTRYQETSLSGRYGDTSGRQLYQSLSTEPLTKWKKIIANPLRRYKCRKYLRWLGEDRLNVMGYNLGQLRDELDDASLSARYVGSDIVRMGYGTVYRRLEPQILERKIKQSIFDGNN